MLWAFQSKYIVESPMGKWANADHVDLRENQGK